MPLSCYNCIKVFFLLSIIRIKWQLLPYCLVSVVSERVQQASQEVASVISVKKKIFYYFTGYLFWKISKYFQNLLFGVKQIPNVCIVEVLKSQHNISCEQNKKQSINVKAMFWTFNLAYMYIGFLLNFYRRKVFLWSIEKIFYSKLFEEKNTS